MRYDIVRTDLKNKCASQFKEKDVIKVGKYFIWIKYGDYTRASMLTTVNTDYDLRDLPIGKQPQYIRDFIERDITEVIQ